jgi:hypothetical protein
MRAITIFLRDYIEKPYYIVDFSLGVDFFEFFE